MSTIKRERPDLLADREATASPIGLEIPPSWVEQFKKEEIEDIGLPMTASFLTGVNTNVQDWYV